MEAPFNKLSVDKVQFLVFLRKFFGLYMRKPFALCNNSRKLMFGSKNLKALTD